MTNAADNGIVGNRFTRVGTAIKLTGSSRNGIGRQPAGASGGRRRRGHLWQQRQPDHQQQHHRHRRGAEGGRRGVGLWGQRHADFRQRHPQQPALWRVDQELERRDGQHRHGHRIQPHLQHPAGKRRRRRHRDVGPIRHRHPHGVQGNDIRGVGGLATDTTGWLDRHKSFGIYLDDIANGVTVRDNFIRDTGVASVFIHGGDANRVSNNIAVLANPRERFIRLEWAPQAGDRRLLRDNSVTGNVVSSSSGKDYWEFWSPGSYTVAGNLWCRAPAR